ncbi:MAG: carbamoyl-phosphate synthase large subunit [Euryarchaeota archaeon]|nr:carbamoyl-phosphate synthase large subunit [Euryarchaeota archaeon]
MPKREDLHKILIIGSGPIVIGQACEFDYSGTQACKALREEGYEIVLVNSNPATIMTDPEMADITYIEPLTFANLERIIEMELPDGLLPNLGGQTALNLSAALYKAGVLEKHGVAVIGVQPDAIERGEDRIAFKATMDGLGIEMPESAPAYTVEESERIAEKLGYPVVVRPAYTMGGTGGGLVYNLEELRTIAARGIAASLVGQVLIEESVLGWEELELEVVRDAKNQLITVCFIENCDPMGVHTGDSFCVAPMLTVPQKLQKRMQDYSYRIVEGIGVIGGTNVQFAHDLETDRLVVIEINPRTSRSSALASKATGFPIARISTKLAAGITMDEIEYWRDGTLEKYTPGGDYVVAKFPRWAFEKFKGVDDVLGTQMRAVGEVMSIGKNFKESFQKAIRSLEVKRYGAGRVKEFESMSLDELMGAIGTPSSERIFQLYEALKKGLSVDEGYERTKIGKWFIQQMKELTDFEREMEGSKDLSDEMLIAAKKSGFSDRYVSEIFGVPETGVRNRRLALGMVQSHQTVPVSGADGAYYYSTYNGIDQNEPVDGKKILILGGGPNRIGQGIEFDYTCVHTTFALRDAGIKTIMVNCNPETVSTDYDTSDKLYFEPLTVEDVLSIYEKEKPDGAIVQFGGQTPLNIAKELQDAGVTILGTSPESIDVAEDRERFKDLMIELDIPQPENDIARSFEDAIEKGEKIGYPLMVRPSYVLGGRGMEVVYDKEMLINYARMAVEVTPEHPILIDKFLEDATEVEVDAISDGKDTFTAAIMEHIELAGVHSGDSACVIPSRTITDANTRTIKEYTAKMGRALGVVGLMNIQYAIADDVVYILEANPRASRTVPLVSKVTGIPLANIATQIIALGKTIPDFPELKEYDLPHVAVKEAVFPFNMFPEVDPVLGPEMRATGEVMGIADNFGMAFFKAQDATGTPLPTDPGDGGVLVTVPEWARDKVADAVRKLASLGFTIHATRGTKEFLDGKGVTSELAQKLHEGRPNIVDAIENKKIQLVFNVPVGRKGKEDDSYIRKAAIKHRVPYITSAEAIVATVEGIETAMRHRITVKSLQAYRRDLG